LKAIIKTTKTTKTTATQKKGISVLIALMLMLAFAPFNTHAAEAQNDKFWHNVLLRNYDYYIPDNVKPNAPLLLVIHGIFANSERLYPAPSVLSQLADEQGFVIMWMQGGTTPVNSWNAGPCCPPAATLNVDDNGYIREAVNRMRGRVAIDDTRVYVFGHSNGASMAQRLALQSSDMFAAIVPMSFPLVDNITWRIPNSWAPVHKVPVLAMHAVDDNVISYDGGLFISPLILPSAQKGRDAWAQVNGCTGSPVKADHPTGVGSYTETYKNCKQDVSVALLTFPQGQHRPWFPDVNGGVDVQRDLWAFLSQHQKPGHKSDRLWAGQELYQQQYLTTADNKSRLDFQADGNLVLRNTQTGQVIWQAGSNGSGADRLAMQEDGNLVLWRSGYWGWKSIFPFYYEPRAVWSSNTSGAGESRVQVSAAGKLQILRNNLQVWTKG
jgi:polyhydroxybutyrate depolymerase